MSNSQYYCGTGNIDVTSTFNKVALAYTSSSTETAGKFSCYLTLVPESQSNCDCGYSISPKIVSGTETRVNEFPSMVGMIYAPDNSIFCGGTISKYDLVSEFVKLKILLLQQSATIM